MGRKFSIVKYKKNTGSSLPDAYQQLEYIKSDGNQYIDLGCTGNQDTKIETTLYLDATAFGNLFGARIGAANCNISSFTGGGVYYVDFNYNDYTTYRVSDSASTITNKKILIENNKNYRRITDVETTSIINQNATNMPDTFTTNTNLYLFWMSGNPYIPAKAAMQCYSFKLYDNNTLIRNLVPCYLKSDPTQIGLYDLCGSICPLTNSPFYTNSGTSTFEKGPEIVNYKFVESIIEQHTGSSGHSLPAEYQEVSYIESTGTQYIDTGIVPTDTSGMKSTFIPLAQDDMVLAGCCYSDSRFAINPAGSGINLSWNSVYASPVAQIIGKSYTCDFNYCNSRQRNVNETSCAAISEALRPQAYNILIFAGYWNSTTPQYYAKARLNSLEITDGINLVRNFIPCYRKADNTPGLYDIVNNVFYINQATSGEDFKVGPDVYNRPKFRIIEQTTGGNQ